MSKKLIALFIPVMLMTFLTGAAFAKCNADKQVKECKAADCKNCCSCDCAK